MRFLLALFLASTLQAQGLPASVEARVVATLVKNSSEPGRIAVSDKQMAAEFEKVGLKVDPGAKIAWAGDREEVAQLAKEGKLVVCRAQALLAEGAAVAIFREKSQPAVYLHVKHVSAAKVRLSPSLYQALGAELP
jgi:hypothetical protein